MASAVLAIEASQRAMGVAIRATPGAPIDALEVPPSTDSEDHLMQVIDAACRGAGVSPAGIAAIAVSIGPGGFTGLRVACATAKAIADVTGCALVAVPSALVVARECVRAGAIGDGACTVALASKAHDAWCTPVDVKGGMPSGAGAALLSGDGAPLRGALIADAHVPAALAARFPEGSIPARWSAVACLEVGEFLRAEGQEIDPLALAPLYPRPPEAVSLWEARHGGKVR